MIRIIKYDNTLLDMNIKLFFLFYHQIHCRILLEFPFLFCRIYRKKQKMNSMIWGNQAYIEMNYIDFFVGLLSGIGFTFLLHFVKHPKYKIQGLTSIWHCFTIY